MVAHVVIIEPWAAALPEHLHYGRVSSGQEAHGIRVCALLHINKFPRAARTRRARAIKHLPYEKKGRKADQLAPVITTYWHPSNGSIEESQVTNSCEKQRVYWCTCKKHTHTITTHALVGTHPTGYACKICAQVADSRPEHVVRAALERTGTAFEVFTKVLCGKFGAVDFWLPSYNLIIQVDGPGHIEEGCKSVSLDKQVDIDRRFGDESMRQCRRLLRLHHRDVLLGDAQRYICLALWFCTRSPTHAFIMYSKRYRLKGWEPEGFGHAL